MTEDRGTLRERQYRWFQEVAEANWEGVVPKNETDPGSLRKLQLQLQLWAGDELGAPVYFEMSHGAPAQTLVDAAHGTLTNNNAVNAEALYLHAVTESYFVAVDLAKAGGQVAEADVSVFVTPRDRLESLSASEWMTRAPEPDTIRLGLQYSSHDREFVLPHADPYVDAELWRNGGALALFESLREDLWANDGWAKVIVS